MDQNEIELREILTIFEQSADDVVKALDNDESESFREGVYAACRGVRVVYLGDEGGEL